MAHPLIAVWSYQLSACLLMMTSPNGSIFRVTGPMWGEFTGHRRIPFTKASDAVLWCFLWPAPEQTANNRDAGDLRLHRAHYDVTVMSRRLFLGGGRGGMPYSTLNCYNLEWWLSPHWCIFFTSYVLLPECVFVRDSQHKTKESYLSAKWNWNHLVEIAILHQPSTDSTDINTRLQRRVYSSIPSMHLITVGHSLAS